MYHFCLLGKLSSFDKWFILRIEKICQYLPPHLGSKPNAADAQGHRPRSALMNPGRPAGMDPESLRARILKQNVYVYTYIIYFIFVLDFNLLKCL